MDTDAREYIRDMVNELGAMALARGNKALAYILGMAEREADNLIAKEQAAMREAAERLGLSASHPGARDHVVLAFAKMNKPK